jgi:hypothetical protein
MLTTNSRKMVERSLSRNGGRTPGFLPAKAAKSQDVYSPTPVMAQVDDINRSIVMAAASQAGDDLAIHRLMFEPVARTRRPAVPLTQETM